MADLTDDRLSRIARIREDVSPWMTRYDEYDDVESMVAEIRRHRAARSASKERVHAAVVVAFREAFDGDFYKGTRAIIAERVADQLATPALSAPVAWRCPACNRFRPTSDGENYDAACVCGFGTAPVLSAEDRGTLKTLRDTLGEFEFLPEIPRTVALLDRLLGGGR